MLTTFDLTFHCPENLRVVATGELLSDEVSGGAAHRSSQNASARTVGRFQYRQL